MTWLLPLAIIIPLAAAGLTLVASRRPRVQRVISVGALAVQLIVELVMLLQVSNTGEGVVHVGGWTAPFGITLVADQLAAFMLVVSTTVSLAVLVYAGLAGHGGRFRTPESPVSIFHPTFLILVTGVSNAFIAGQPVNLFGHSGGNRQLRAAHHRRHQANGCAPGAPGRCRCCPR